MDAQPGYVRCEHCGNVLKNARGLKRHLATARCTYLRYRTKMLSEGYLRIKQSRLSSMRAVLDYMGVVVVDARDIPWAPRWSIMALYVYGCEKYDGYTPMEERIKPRFVITDQLTEALSRIKSSPGMQAVLTVQLKMSSKQRTMSNRAIKYGQVLVRTEREAPCPSSADSAAEPCGT